MLLVLLLCPVRTAAAEAAVASPSPPRPRIGLALSGGGARGAAHIGVLKVLEELRVPVDVVAGTSMGAIIGGLYASGLSAQQLEQVMVESAWADLFRDAPPRENLSFRRKEDDRNFLAGFRWGLRDGGLVLPAGLVQGQQLSLLLRRLLLHASDVREFDALHLPFRAVATDLETGQEVVLASGDLTRALRASMSIPGAFAPVEIEGRLLVDGMVSNNLPVAVTRELGADLILAVDVGTPLADRSRLRGALDVANQILSILTVGTTQRQLAQLRPGDLLLRPELGAFGTTAFEDGASIIAAGEDAARAMAADLEALRLSPEAYAQWQLEQRLGESRPPVITAIDLEMDSALGRGAVEPRLRTKLGEPLDVERLEADLAQTYGLDWFERVDYELVGSGAERVLRIRADEKSWGPHYLRFGLRIEENFDNTSVYELAFNYTQAPVNALGGEWRNELEIGESPRLFTELWQPLDERTSWFVAPSLEWSRARLPVYEGDSRRGELSDQRLTLGFDVGRLLGNWGELRIGARYGDGRVRPLVGPSSLSSQRVQTGGLFLRFATDTLDDSYFPRRGGSAGLVLGTALPALGAEERLEIFSYQWARAFTTGRNTLVLRTRGSTVFGGDGELGDLARAGGFLELSGLDRNQLSGRHALLGQLIGYRELASFGLLSFRWPLFAGGSLEMGNTWQRRSDISFSSSLLAGSLFLGLETPLGPVFLGYGVAEGGRSSAYFFVGRPF